MNSRLIYIHTMSSMHAGTGASTGAIDLAIARERATGIPYLPGSSLKGALRDRARQVIDAEDTIHHLFGPPTDRASDHAGALSFGDARLVLMPVRSFAGTFAYVTSPYVLQRLAGDLAATGNPVDWQVPSLSDVDDCLVAANTVLKVKDQVVFEDLVLKPREDASLTSIAQTLRASVSDQDRAPRLCVVHDDVMSFLMAHCTEVTTRIRLESETKTVAQGALWTEECIPSEALLVSLAVANPPKFTGLDAQQVFDGLGPCLEGVVQLGGKSTVGKGMCRLRM